MNDETAARLLAAPFPSALIVERFAGFTVTVANSDWLAALTHVRDVVGARYFDFLTGVDEAEDGFAIVAHLYCPPSGPHLHLRTTCPRDQPSVPSAVGVFAGAAWHERETHEMFGIDFPGHPHLITLLLPDGFEGNPLRKEFLLAARATKAWPGAKEPGEGHEAAVAVEGRVKRTNVATGTPPDPETWPAVVPVETRYPEGRGLARPVDEGRR